MRKIETKLLLTSLLIYISTLASAQFIDNYGFRAGIGLSNQYWEFENQSLIEYAIGKENRHGILVYINAEKYFNKNLAIRTEFGYNQKGFPAI